MIEYKVQVFYLDDYFNEMKLTPLILLLHLLQLGAMKRSKQYSQ